MTGKVRVFVADDHEIVRTGLRRLLDDAPDLTCCGEAADVRELVVRGPAAGWQVLVLDVKLPGSRGPQILPDLLALTPAPRIVVFTMLPEDGHAVAWLRAGASAFLNKKRPSKELLDAVRTVHAGRRYITPTLADHLFENQINLSRAPHELLSDREFEVVRALAGGARSTDLAAELGLAVSTVNTYVQRIKEKLGVKTIVDIVTYARDNDLLV